MFEDIIKTWQAGTRKGLEVFGASIYDNPHLDRNEIARLEAIYPEGSTQRRIRLGGEYLPGMSGARAYTNFDSRVHVKHQEWPPLPRRPICWCWDFNVEPMVSIIGQRDRKVFRVYREFVLDEGNVGEICDMFYEALPNHTGEIYVYGDATGKGRSAQTGQSYYTLIMNAMRHYGSPLRIKVPEANPHVSDRVNAVNYALRGENGESMVEVDPSCKELIADMEGTLGDGRGKIKKTSNRKDPYFRRSHISDAFGYWVVYDEPVRAVASQHRKRVKIEPPGYAFAR